MANRTDHFRGDRELDQPLAYLTSIEGVKKVFPASGHTHKHRKAVGTFTLQKTTDNGCVLKLYHSSGSIPVFVSCTNTTAFIDELRRKGKLT